MENKRSPLEENKSDKKKKSFDDFRNTKSIIQFSEPSLLEKPFDKPLSFRSGHSSKGSLTECCLSLDFSNALILANSLFLVKSIK